MPDVEVERKLLCGTCKQPEDGLVDWHSGAVVPAHPNHHPFDGVPYVRCPECAGSGVYSSARVPGEVGTNSVCRSCNGLGWVQEEARA